jgi:deazaflavin-dependent oxidoreductase (nitroreductase family)
VPGFGVVLHRGRRSGRGYRTPVNVFPTEDGYLFALTYGPDADWVRNVLAAGGCELRTRGRSVRLVEPRLVHDERRQGVRPVERQILRLLGVADFLILRTAPPGRDVPAGRQPAQGIGSARGSQAGRPAS